MDIPGIRTGRDTFPRRPCFLNAVQPANVGIIRPSEQQAQPQTIDRPPPLPLVPPQLAVLLQNGLNRSSYTVPTTLIDLIFPPSSLPFCVDDDLLKKLQWTELGEERLRAPGVWNGKEFRDTPTNFTEEVLGAWMNKLAQAMSLVTGKPVRRSWSHCSEDILAMFLLSSYKPGLVLFDVDYISRFQTYRNSSATWTFIKATAEVTPEKKTPEQVLHSAITKSLVCFQRQQARRFMISLYFNGSGEMALILVDREGLLRTQEIQLMKAGHVVALMFLKALAGLMFGTVSEIGLDPNYEVNESTGDVTAITVDKTRFKVENMIYSLDFLFARGTRVWIVKHNGGRVILKDSWVQVDQIGSEHEFLAAMSALPDNIKNSLPTLICGGDVKIDGILDTTSRHRAGLVSSAVHLVRRCIVCKPVGEPLTKFRSKKEFISAIIDVINAHCYLYNKLGILHRDISLNNILLHRVNEHETTGLLVDFDHAEFIVLKDAAAENALSAGGALSHEDDDMPTDRKSRRGTPTFMAIEVLTSTEEDFDHMPYHDLESILYVIIYTCIFTDGPDSQRPISQLPNDPPFFSLFRGEHDNGAIANFKIGLMERAARLLLPGFSEYWADFAPFVLDLIKVCFPRQASDTNSLTYKGMLEILSRARDIVQEKLPSRQAGGEVRKKRQAQDRADDSDVPRSKRGRRILEHLD